MLLDDDDLDEEEFEIADDEFEFVVLTVDDCLELDEFDELIFEVVPVLVDDDDVLDDDEVPTDDEDALLEPEVETPDDELERDDLLPIEETFVPPESSPYLLEDEPLVLADAEL